MAIHGSEPLNYEVMEECGTISRSGEWEMKLRYMSWKGRDPRYDLRRWKKIEGGKERCGKGITLTGEEVKELKKLLDDLEG